MLRLLIVSRVYIIKDNEVEVWEEWEELEFRLKKIISVRSVA